MTDTEKHYFANDGSDWRSTRSPVDATEARLELELQDEADANADGFTAPNDKKLSHTIVEGSNAQNGPAEPEPQPSTDE